MTAKADFQLDKRSVRAVLRAMDEIGQRGVKTATRGAVSKAVTAVRKELKREVKSQFTRRTGNLERSIGRKLKSYKHTVWGAAGAKRPRGRGGPSFGLAPHEHLLVLGTQERRQRTTGRRTGRVSPNNFPERVLRRMQGRVLRIFARETIRGINRKAKKLRAKR